MGIFKDLFGESVINVIFNEAPSKEYSENENRVNMVNELIRWSAVCGAVKYKIDNDSFLFSSDKRDLERKLETAEKELDYWKRRIAEEMHIDPSKLVYVKH